MQPDGGGGFHDHFAINGGGELAGGKVQFQHGVMGAEFHLRRPHPAGLAIGSGLQQYLHPAIRFVHHQHHQWIAEVGGVVVGVPDGSDPHPSRCQVGAGMGDIRLSRVLNMGLGSAPSGGNNTTCTVGTVAVAMVYSLPALGGCVVVVVVVVSAAVSSGSTV